ncbi:MAG: phosphoenolpyruvate carboxykinase (ATP) [Candidatus Krumholzibacteriia bacterium]
MSKYLKIKSPAQGQAEELKSDFGIENHGLKYLKRAYWNLPAEALYEEFVFRGEGHIVNHGPLLVNTGKWSARAANDKFVVREHETEERVWWGEYNRPISPEKFAGLVTRMQAYLQGEEVFVQDCYAGQDPEHRLAVRIITEDAWQAQFARNMFILPKTREEHQRFVPDFTLLALPSFKADPIIDGTRSETAIIINFAERLALVAGSSYGGEIKKSIFTVMNFLLPLKGVLSMHCSANLGKQGDVALFFGLSGTGKTTLSADPRRQLIGDDEHGWSDTGVFNVEGGCYAKVIRLSPEYEPQIYATTSRFGTILENVVYDPTTRKLDLDDDRHTENTRSSYPLHFVPGVLEAGYAESHPKNIILLTCDASGVLPPIARLTPEQTVYHFISGYTSKIAGTEIGLGIEPKITFSACFGAPFMVHHPYVYADMLRQKMQKHGARCWLVNTGWTGGPFGVGKRISIHHTRALLNAAMEGRLEDVEYREDRLFGFSVPKSCPEVPAEVLVPENTWGDKDEYWRRYDGLAARFIENFKLFKSGTPAEIVAVGPRRMKDGVVG